MVWEQEITKTHICMSKDFITNLETCNIFSNAFNVTGKNGTEDIQFWFHQTKKQSDSKRVGFSKSPVTGIDGGSLNT